ncbi:MAG: Smr/MutS family protein [Acidobacteriota bacterium]|nr:Smr/MutS family protein [Acidobacteriota bacterium]
MPHRSETEAGEEMMPEETFEMEITDILDLHSFPPREVKDLVQEYLEVAYQRGLRNLRIIHGRGIGVQRKTVRRILERHPRVQAYGDAPAEAGGWGATWVEME